MPRYLAVEGGRFPLDFDQRQMTPDGRRIFPDESGPPVIVQALLVAPRRPRKLKLTEA